MDFGKVDTSLLSEIDFTLPPDAPETVKHFELWKTQNSKTKIFVGCAKWGRKDWIGKIYPKGTKESDFLEHYARHFNCIELNATFYRLPTVSQIENWKAKAGDGFKFCPKFTDQITHIRRLNNAEHATAAFLEGISAFGDSLGPAFLQLPPNYPPKNLDVLQRYLESLPKDFQLFVELRHPKWFEEKESFNAVFDMLDEHKVGAVITDASGRRDCVHMRLTTPEAFIRFVGNGLHPTDYTRVDEWVQRIKKWMNNGVQTIYFFMHQHEELHSPELSRYVIQQLNKHCGTNIPEPVFVEDEETVPAKSKGESVVSPTSSKVSNPKKTPAKKKESPAKKTTRKK